MEQASPKPEEAPRTRAHRVRVSPVKTARMLARQNRLDTRHAETSRAL
jgi:hypothetical protein